MKGNSKRSTEHSKYKACKNSVQINDTKSTLNLKTLI